MTSPIWLLSLLYFVSSVIIHTPCSRWQFVNHCSNPIMIHKAIHPILHHPATIPAIPSRHKCILSPQDNHSFLLLLLLFCNSFLLLLLLSSAEFFSALRSSEQISKKRQCPSENKRSRRLSVYIQTQSRNQLETERDHFFHRRL